MDLVDVPATPRETTITELRDFSRRLVRELGFMRATLAESDLAPSAVHAVLEIGMAPGISARDQARSSGSINRTPAGNWPGWKPMAWRARASQEDARSANLYLTPAGETLRSKIDRFATDQVSSALRRLLPPTSRHCCARWHSMPMRWRRTTTARRSVADAASAGIVEGYQPGCIGDIAALHARFYAQHWGFGAFFEQKVATELAAFAGALPAAGKALWLYVENGRALASPAIDGDLDTGVAHLRWFIVDDALRGAGIGRQLPAHAMRFVDALPRDLPLDLQGTRPARHLYEAFGFALHSEAEGEQWGARWSNNASRGAHDASFPAYPYEETFV